MKTRHLLLGLVFLLLCVISAHSQQKTYAMYGVGFYNQENLFDTCHDAHKNDYDFLPNGSYKWNGLKYRHKLHNMATALADMGTDRLPNGCAIIGLSEVENSNCLTDLCAQEPLAKRGMKFVHFEGVDKRGVDCALLYNPSLFKVDESRTKLYPYIDPDTSFYTRGFLAVHGTMAGEHVCAIVCHLPSRLRPGDAKRVLGAKQITAIKEELQKEDKDIKIFIMGDMNDDPTDRSMTEFLRGKENIKDVGKADLYNPWIEVLKKGTGTLCYDGAWNLFDQILITPSLINKDNPKDFTTLKYFKHQVFHRDYLMQTEGKYKGNPKRTTAGGQWLDGYSDHLPVVMYLLKEKK